MVVCKLAVMISSSSPEASVVQVLRRVRISQVWQALGGTKLRSAGTGKYRGQAWWRKGDGWNVSLDDSRGTWYDFRDQISGGILSLIIRVRGGTRQGALQWLAPLAGIKLDGRPLPRSVTDKWRNLKRDLPTATYWRRTAIVLGEALLLVTKAVLSDKPSQVNADELQWVTKWLARLRVLDDYGLVEEYHQWRDQDRQLTAAMVHGARKCAAVEVRALEKYWAAKERGQR
jgi:hypothetical protein